MRYILIIYFLIVVFSTNGQKIVCLNEDFKNEIKDSIITYLQGNLISTIAIEDLQVAATLKNRAKFSFIDSVSKQEYLFIESTDYPRGWLIVDKSRSRVNYIDQETIFVFNTLAKKYLIDKSKNCGFDVFTWSKKNCGFSEPCYNYENGSIIIVENKFCKKKIRLNVNTELGKIDKK